MTFRKPECVETVTIMLREDGDTRFQILTTPSRVIRTEDGLSYVQFVGQLINRFVERLHSDEQFRDETIKDWAAQEKQKGA